MNARIVNLRTRRKQIARDQKREAPSKARVPGVSKAERDRAEAENRRAQEHLDGHRRDDEG
ncbi:MAG TPA: DUF4169 family protein [Paracoccaceae bacterium]|nr:DUF4169 family protein [Paracoccaceae bacterium]